jgi:hypothetical protein
MAAKSSFRSLAIERLIPVTRLASRRSQSAISSSTLATMQLLLG